MLKKEIKSYNTKDVKFIDYQLYLISIKLAEICIKQVNIYFNDIVIEDDEEFQEVREMLLVFDYILDFCIINVKAFKLLQQDNND